VLVDSVVGKDVSEVSRYIPSNDVKQTKHARPSPCACLAEVREVFEIVSCDVAVDGEFTGEALLADSRTHKSGKSRLTLRTNKCTCSSGTPSATKR
jgi:hypothetical protein